MHKIFRCNNPNIKDKSVITGLCKILNSRKLNQICKNSWGGKYKKLYYHEMIEFSGTLSERVYQNIWCVCMRKLFFLPIYVGKKAYFD